MKMTTYVFGPLRKKKKKKKKGKLVQVVAADASWAFDHYFIVFLFSTVISHLVQSTKHESSLNLASNPRIYSWDGNTLHSLQHLWVLILKQSPIMKTRRGKRSEVRDWFSWSYAFNVYVRMFHTAAVVDALLCFACVLISSPSGLPLWWKNGWI